MTTTPTKKRVAKSRATKEAAGYKLVARWVHKSDIPALDRKVAELNKRRGTK
jgi:hypothetical protein